MAAISPAASDVELLRGSREKRHTEERRSGGNGGNGGAEETENFGRSSSAPPFLRVSRQLQLAVTNSRVEPKRPPWILPCHPVGARSRARRQPQVAEVLSTTEVTSPLALTVTWVVV